MRVCLCRVTESKGTTTTATAAASRDDNDTHTFATASRLAERHSTWDASHRMTAVPSVHDELRVQVIDTTRQEVAGEAVVALRLLLDQRPHDEWLVLPPTLRHQLVEKRARPHAARLRLCLTFTHTKVRSFTFASAALGSRRLG